MREDESDALLVVIWGPILAEGELGGRCYDWFFFLRPCLGRMRLLGMESLGF